MDEEKLNNIEGIKEAQVVEEQKEEVEVKENIQSEKKIEGKTEENCKKEAEKENKDKKRPADAFAVALATTAIVLSGATTIYTVIQGETTKPITFIETGSDGNSVNFVEGSIADVANSVSESVVSIVTSTTVTSYFGGSYNSSAAGTGIIVTADGYILSNKHVIDGATNILIVLDDGTMYENVKVAAVDPLNDVAFLKIDGVNDLKPATLGDSKTINVGQQVIAIGNALGEYQNTVTAGIISGTGRSITATDSTGSMYEQLNDMIQTDAAINSGNSGGPLVNAAGEVIGINTATSSSAENMGFAIPISSVKGMLAQLIESETASRAYIGVYSVEITAEIAKEYNLPVTAGSYLYSSSSYTAVVNNSPAAKAGLKDKDIIVAVNGIKVGAAGSLSSLIGEYKPGDVVQLTVIREGSEIAANVELGAYSE
jgi:serine protease Do